MGVGDPDGYRPAAPSISGSATALPREARGHPVPERMPTIDARVLRARDRPLVGRHIPSLWSGPTRGPRRSLDAGRGESV